ncbi:MAG: ATP-binding protein [Bradyrhizobium sp.]
MTEIRLKLEKVLRQQAAIASFGSFSLRELDLIKILTEAARACAEGLSVPFSKVCRYREKENDLLVIAGYGWHPGVIGHVVSRADASSPQGRAFSTGQPFICDDVQKEIGFDLPPFYAAHGIVSTIDVIIKGSNDQPYGILEIDNDQQHDYDQYDINFLTGFANILAEAVATAARVEALQASVAQMKVVVDEKDRLLTERNAADQQLRQAQKMEAVGQLTGGVAHDLNNILTVITGTIEILAEAVEDRPPLAAITKMMDEAATRGAGLIQRLLAFARKQPLQPREVDVNSLVTEAVGMLRPTLGEHVEVHMTLADVSWALIDPGQLTNAILNLALNARDAMPDGGRLTIETCTVTFDEDHSGLDSDITPGSYVVVAVTDTGHGIPADILNNVFEPFFTTKNVDKGSGLGLSMVYGFVKQSDGHIKIYSEEGRGTTVRIYLPQASGVAEPAEPAGSSSVEGGRETVLVVEDDVLVRAFVVAQIQSLGYATVSAVNAQEAMLIINGPRKIDLLFTDMIMPGTMNGRQLADAALPLRPELKVLFTSGYTEDTIIHYGRLDGDVLLLAKPYRKADLARMMRVALDTGSHAEPAGSHQAAAVR